MLQFKDISLLHEKHIYEEQHYGCYEMSLGESILQLTKQPHTVWTCSSVVYGQTKAFGKVSMGRHHNVSFESGAAIDVQRLVTSSHLLEPFQQSEYNLS